MRLRKGDHDPFRPKAHMRVVRVSGLAKEDHDVDHAAIEKRNERYASVFGDIDVDLRMLLGEREYGIAKCPCR